jgi:hypothetical protein
MKEKKCYRFGSTKGTSTGRQELILMNAFLNFPPVPPGNRLCESGIKAVEAGTKKKAAGLKEKFGVRKGRRLLS